MKEGSGPQLKRDWEQALAGGSVPETSRELRTLPRSAHRTLRHKVRLVKESWRRQCKDPYWGDMRASHRPTCDCARLPDSDNAIGEKSSRPLCRSMRTRRDGHMPRMLSPSIVNRINLLQETFP